MGFAVAEREMDDNENEYCFVAQDGKCESEVEGELVVDGLGGARMPEVPTTLATFVHSSLFPLL